MTLATFQEVGVLSHASSVSSSVLSSTSNKLVSFLQSVSVLLFPTMAGLYIETTHPTVKAAKYAVYM